MMHPGEKERVSTELQNILTWGLGRGLRAVMRDQWRTKGEGNGNPLRYSCLENPVNRGPWWAAVHRVTQSRTRLKRLSSSSRRTKTRGTVMQHGTGALESL